jgi:hypothetical protein
MTSREDTRQMMVKTNIDDLKKVQEYLKAHPLSNIMEVYSKTGVSMSQILNFVKYGVLKIRVPKAG